MMSNIKKFVLFLLLMTALFSCKKEKPQMFVVAGTGTAGFKDGDSAEFNKPIRLTPYKNNSVVIADINNHAIRIVSLDGNVQTIAGGPDLEGYLDGEAKQAKFKSPHGVAYNAKSGEIFVAEAGNHIIRKISQGETGNYVVSTYAGVPEKGGYNDGELKQAMFNSPHGIILNAEGDLIVADIGNARIRKISNGMVSTISGTGTFGQDDGEPLQATYKYPMDMVLGDGGNILIADAGTNLIRKLKEDDSVSTVQTSEALKTPHGIAYDENGNIYIADMGTHRILKIDSKGKVSVLCGTGESGSAVNQLNKPAAVLAHAGYLWIADLNNHQIKAIGIE